MNLMAAIFCLALKTFFPGIFWKIWQHVWKIIKPVSREDIFGENDLRNDINDLKYGLGVRLELFSSVMLSSGFGQTTDEVSY